MKIPELLIPAGDLEKLRTAVRFGADAVYIGGGEYSLRTVDTSFTLEEIEIGVRFAHERGVKVYLALNILPYDQDVIHMMAYLEKAIPLGIDAVIVSDAGMVHEIRSRGLPIRIHLSTQANTLNTSAVRFWSNQGVSRIVLARELNLLQIGEIAPAVPDVELEVFVHGSMCMAYSGRCLISREFTGRAANRGECTHPCRWKYHLTEDEDRGRVLEVDADERGTYILNAKDLCMIEHIPELIKSGVHSFKIEGRMKSAYYVAIVTKIYRAAIDRYCTGPGSYVLAPSWLNELQNISHRPYATGFFFGNGVTEKGEMTLQEESTSRYIKTYDFVGTVAQFDESDGTLLVQVRNRIRVGDVLDVIDPHQAEIRSFTVERIIDDQNNVLSSAHNQYTVRLRCPFTVSAFSLLRAPHERPVPSDMKDAVHHDA